MSDFSEQIEKAPLIFFLGAGASVPLGKPTALGFWEQLKENPIEPPEAQQVLLGLEANVRARDKDAVIDIELILDELVRWEDSAAEFATNPVSQTLQSLKENLSENQARVAHQALLARVVDVYADVNEYDAYALWGPVLEWAWSTGIRTLPIFTLNYDTVIEQAVLFADDAIRADQFNSEYGGGDAKYHADPGYLALRDGFDLRHREFATWDNWNLHGYDEDPDTLTVALFKLHGSTTWTFMDLHVEEIEVGGRVFRQLSGPVGLLAPGLGRDPRGRTTAIHYPYLTKDVAAHDIFNVPFAYFGSCLRNSKLCVAIGCSFRDERVVEAVATSTNTKGLELPSGVKYAPMRETATPLEILVVAPSPDDARLAHALDAKYDELAVEVLSTDAKFDVSYVPQLLERIASLL